MNKFLRNASLYKREMETGSSVKAAEVYQAVLNQQFPAIVADLESRLGGQVVTPYYP
jgi:hypothetical protein